jgi:hypothetical protein
VFKALPPFAKGGKGGFLRSDQRQNALLKQQGAPSRTPRPPRGEGVATTAERAVQSLVSVTRKDLPVVLDNATNVAEMRTSLVEVGPDPIGVLHGTSNPI